MNKCIVYLFLVLCVGCFFGCKSSNLEDNNRNSKRNLSKIETNNRYLLSSEISTRENLCVAVINVVMPEKGSGTIAAELTFGGFKPQRNGRVYVHALTDTLRYQSMTKLVDAVAARAADSPIGIFMLVNDTALGTYTNEEISFEIIAFTRELDSLFADRNIQQVYLIPDNFSISYK